MYIEYEKYFSKYQMAKIFYIKSINKKDNDLNEYTNVLPYFIIKCEIFSDLQNFLQICNKFNNDNNYIFHSFYFNRIFNI